MTDTQSFQTHVADAARDFVIARRASLGLSEHADFALRSVGQSKGGQHVRLDQTHRGIKVWGGQAIVHAKKGVIERVTGKLVGGLNDFDAVIAFNDADAVSLAKADYASLADGKQQLVYQNEKIELLIYMKDKQPHLAWHVYFFTDKQDGVDPGRWNYFIDATTGETLDAFNWLTTLPQQASGPGGNPNVARTWTATLDVTPVAAQYQMNTTVDGDIALPEVHGLITENWNMGTTAGVVVTGPLDPIGDAALNDAHGFTEQVLDMMYTWYGYDSIADLDPFTPGGADEGYVVRSRVHYDFMYENAFWDGTQMTYGDGQTYFFPLTGDIDVIAHETNHGFTERHSDLIYSAESGGMNESFSDVAGTIAEFFAEGDGATGADWLIGHDIARPGQLPGDALRFMCDPPLDGVSIDNYNDYSGQDVHFTSGIGNKAFCLASSRLSDPMNYDPTTTPTVAGVQRAGDAWYQANAFEWGPSTGFSDSCNGIVAAANTLGFTAGEIQALVDSFLDVGVACAGQTPPLQCDALWTTDTGVITSPNYPNDYPNNWNFTDCIQPASGAIPTLTFTNFNVEANWDFVYVSDGSSGAILSTNTGTALPPPATAPIIVVRFTSDGSVVRPGWRATWDSTGGGNQPPVASFTYAATDLDVTFTDTSTDADGMIVGWDWNFGDGTTSTVQNPTHSYTAGGTYNVSLTVTDELGGFDTTSMSITVVEPNIPPTADFTYAVTDLDVVFTDTSVDTDGTLVAWAWNFGDGTTSTAQNPTHSYAAGGTYNVTLTVTDDGGDSDTAMMSISVVEPNIPPTASFTYADTNLDVVFTDTSTDADGMIVGWDWSFGDGNTSTEQNPTNSYAAAGTYTVTLTITDDRGDSDTATADITVIEANELPTAAFTWTATDLDVVFTDASTDADGTITAWSWDLGDGTTSTDQNPTHTYAADGDYTVVLTITDDRGDTATATQTVSVLAANLMPTADFSFAATDLAVTFTDASADPDGVVASWAWDFGDGTTSTDQSPSHSYGAAGTYTVTLAITDDRGGSATSTQSVTVTDGGGVGGGGCCDTNGQKEPPWSALIVLVGLVLMRRRRRATIAG